MVSTELVVSLMLSLFRGKVIALEDASLHNDKLHLTDFVFQNSSVINFIMLIRTPSKHTRCINQKHTNDQWKGTITKKNDTTSMPLADHHTVARSVTPQKFPGTVAHSTRQFSPSRLPVSQLPRQSVTATGGLSQSPFRRNEQPSVSLALPPVG